MPATTPRTIHYALSRRVLCVAVLNDDNSWEAFVDAVPGRDHFAEEAAVLAKGTRLQPWIAKQCFPRFAGLEYRT